MTPRSGSSPVIDSPSRRATGRSAPFRARGSCCDRRQVPDPDEVVNRCCEREHPADAPMAAMAGLPHKPHGLEPSEDLFDPLALPLALDVSSVTRCPAVDGTRAIRGVLRHVWRHLQEPEISHEL